MRPASGAMSMGRRWGQGYRRSCPPSASRQPCRRPGGGGAGAVGGAALAGCTTPVPRAARVGVGQARRHRTPTAHWGAPGPHLIKVEDGGDAPSVHGVIAVEMHGEAAAATCTMGGPTRQHAGTRRVGGRAATLPAAGWEKQSSWDQPRAPPPPLPKRRLHYSTIGQGLRMPSCLSLPPCRPAAPPPCHPAALPPCRPASLPPCRLTLVDLQLRGLPRQAQLGNVQAQQRGQAAIGIHRRAQRGRGAQLAAAQRELGLVDARLFQQLGGGAFDQVGAVQVGQAG